MKRRTLLLTATVLFCSLAPAGALADSTTDALKKVEAAFTKLHTFRATMDNGKMTSQMDYVAPDRYHLTMHMSHDMETMLIGDDIYMKMNDKWMKLPLPGVKAMVAHYREPVQASKWIDDAKTTDLGKSTLGDVPVHQYAIDSDKSGTHTVMSIGPKDLPLQIVIEQTGKHPSTSTIKYSDFDGPLTVDPPQM